MSRYADIINCIIRKIREEVPRDKLPGMVSKFSHDFRTPLAGAITALKMYDSHYHVLSEDQKRELIHNALEQATTLDNSIIEIVNKVCPLPKKDKAMAKAEKHWYPQPQLKEAIA